jgi:hypothetical protein
LAQRKYEGAPSVFVFFLQNYLTCVDEILNGFPLKVVGLFQMFDATREEWG